MTTETTRNQELIRRAVSAERLQRATFFALWRLALHLEGLGYPIRTWIENVVGDDGEHVSRIYRVKVFALPDVVECEIPVEELQSFWRTRPWGRGQIRDARRALVLMGKATQEQIGGAR